MQLTLDLLAHTSGIGRYTKKCGNRAPYRTMEFVSLEGPHEGIVERPHDLGGQSVEVPAVRAFESPAATSKGESVVAYRADPILRLPISTSLDGDPCMQCVVDGVPEQFVRGGRRFVWLFESLPEQQPELRPGRAEFGRWRK